MLCYVSSACSAWPDCGIRTPEESHLRISSRTFLGGSEGQSYKPFTDKGEDVQVPIGVHGYRWRHGRVQGQKDTKKRRLETAKQPEHLKGMHRPYIAEGAVGCKGAEGSMC